MSSEAARGRGRAYLGPRLGLLAALHADGWKSFYDSINRRYGTDEEFPW